MITKRHTQLLRRAYLLGLLVVLTYVPPAYPAAKPAHQGDRASAPSSPMRPRYADPRISYTTAGASELHADNTEGPAQAEPPSRWYIRRYRLEKRNPAAVLSDVTQPIIFYIDPAIPASLVPWIQRGVEAWQPAFEAIGFRNAILARKAPREAQGDAWPAFTKAHNAIVWDVASRGLGKERGMIAIGVKGDGSEITVANILLGPGSLLAAQRLAFVLLGDDPRVPLLFPDSLTGQVFPDSLTSQVITALISHEVGHTLGLFHNFKASSTYPTDSLRSRAFVRRMGHSPSIMDYSILNAIAQPEDSFSPQERITRIGPYDVFAVQWAYRPIPDAATPEAELPILESWRKAQDTTPYLRSQSPSIAGALGVSPVDPRDDPYDLGGEPVVSAQAIIRNLARVGGRLAAFQASKRPAAELERVKRYQDYVIERWSLALSAAARLVGSREPVAPFAHSILAAQPLAPVDSAEQVAALRLVLDYAFRGRDALVQTQFASAEHPVRDAAALARLDTLPNGWNLTKFREAQSTLLASLLYAERLERLADPAQGHRGILPVFCTEMDVLRRELVVGDSATAPAAAREVRERIDKIVTGPSGVCRRHGWSPRP